MTRTQNYYDGENYFTVKDSIRVDSEFIEAFFRVGYKMFGSLFQTLTLKRTTASAFTPLI